MPVPRRRHHGCLLCPWPALCAIGAHAVGRTEAAAANVAVDDIPNEASEELKEEAREAREADGAGSAENADDAGDDDDALFAAAAKELDGKPLDVSHAPFALFLFLFFFKSFSAFLCVLFSFECCWACCLLCMRHTRVCTLYCEHFHHRHTSSVPALA